jgi:hypothetical protein
MVHIDMALTLFDWFCVCHGPVPHRCGENFGNLLASADRNSLLAGNLARIWKNHAE